MNSAELTDRTEEVADNLKSRLGDIQALGVIPGTGWKDGVNNAFKEKEAIPYSELGIPGSELEVEGHKKILRVGEFEGGKDGIVIGRVHPNENITHADLRQSMSIVLGGLRHNLKGLLITNGVGSLHGPVGVEKGWLHSFVRSRIIEVLAWVHRGRREQTINVGDIALVDDIKTSAVGSLTPLGAGEFVDFYHNGIHRDEDRYFQAAKEVIEEVQGKCPIAQSRFIAGPQFEGPADKIEFKSKGDDIIGMSGIQEALASTKFDIPFAQAVLATNGPFGAHSHEGNQDVGSQNLDKSTKIITELADRWPDKKAD